MSSDSDPSGAVARALDGVRELYDRGLAAHGATSRAVGWPDVDKQALRFAKLAHALEAGTRSVADFGCGYGALLPWLDEHGYAVDRFVGYDLSTDMLAAAPCDPRARWVHGSRPDEDVDVTLVSGTFNVRLGAYEDAWAEHVRTTLTALWTRTRAALAFNVLTAHVDWREDHLFYADPVQWFEWCRSALSPRVALLHDYPLWEFTLVVRRAR